MLSLHVRVTFSKLLSPKRSFATGPFELTKLSAQISVLMADRNKSSVQDPVRSSYQQKGTFNTAKNIILHRGVMGLYSGFGFHLCKHIVLSYAWETLTRWSVVRDTIGTAIYFTTYESGKQLLVKFQGSDSPTPPSSVAVAGGLCGLVSWACVCLPICQSTSVFMCMLIYFPSRYTPLTQPKLTTSATASPKPRANQSKFPEFNLIKRQCIEVSASQWQDHVSLIPFSFRVLSR